MKHYCFKLKSVAEHSHVL